MPELPEVESIRLGLNRKILGSKILSVEILKPKIIAGNGTKRIASKKKTDLFIKNVANKKITGIKRIAKNLIIELDDKSILLVHLKMTGQLVFVDKKKNKTLGGHPITESYLNDLPNKHTCIIFTLNNGTLFYNDIRMFGYVLYYKNILEAKESGHFKNIGLDPFQKEFTLAYFKKEILKKNKNIKSVLLEQSVVTGSGNIYADEICFASKVLPNRNCKTLTEKEISALYKNIKKILALAVEHGGSSVNNYLLADGSRGNYTRLHKVYGKTGEKCVICKNILQKEIVAGRTTVFCKTCQK
ncbi:Formamidopyrimidine-DNA glycosylase [bioreactor metagenome]|uniref:Formamidopyrimidine-DNA glycosylase n=1 Tax=bioreactor metagenome TaxID=1076179 RepID=A0A644UAG1_9ZZZZ|nr:bifunctional DNA-formamidopyrimidine glycosylase/DNA-(apurinic or apyrimidinic site) lyase [Candidatus Elulimicrobiales bacterium]